jgi:hypothetical protein
MVFDKSIWLRFSGFSLALLTQNVSKHTSVTTSPSFEYILDLRQCCTYYQVRFFLGTVTLATSSINCALFIDYIPFFILTRCMINMHSRLPQINPHHADKIRLLTPDDKH